MFDEILGSYDRCNDNVKFAICSLVISTKDISNSDGRNCGIIGTDLGSPSFSLEHSMKTIIQEHKNSFMPSKGIYNPAKQNLFPTITQVRKQTTKRLKSKREQIINKTKHRNRLDAIFEMTAKPNIRVKRSCTFCGSNDPGENIKNCRKRKYLQRMAKEFTIGKNGNNLEDFLRKVEFDHVFSTQSSVPSDVYTELGKARGKQLFVHQIWRSLFATTLSQFQFNDMILEVSYVNQKGYLENEKIAVTRKSIHSLLCARNGATKLSYLYDGTHIKHSENVTHLKEHGNSESKLRKSD